MKPKYHTLFLILAALCGLVILTPQINFQSAISVGDHGLNFYTFQRVAHGDKLYQDFWWGYGPLSPHYYAFFYKFVGETMSSVILGRMLLIFLSGIFCYLTVASFAPPLLALAASLWFWLYNPDFFYSYNHTGAFTAFLALSYFIFSYYKNGRSRYIVYSLITLFLLNLIRINIGLALLIGFIVAIFMADKYIHRKNQKENLIRNMLAGLGICLLSGLIYWFMLKGLPSYAISQCMPYFSKTYHNVSSSEKYIMYFKFLFYIIGQSSRYVMAFTIVIAAIILTTRELIKSTDQKVKTDMFFALGTISGLIILVAHEFIMGYQLYRVNWTIPYQIVLFCLIIGFAVKKYNSKIQYSVIVFILFVALFDSGRYLYRLHNKFKVPGQFLTLKNAKIYVGNERAWIKTVEQTTNYLNEVLKDDETFFAVPYEPLYYFLTNRKSPTWHVLFMVGTELNAIQEQQMIEILKNKKIRYVLLSNRYRSKEADMGELGVTHLKELAKYINENFQTEVTFGSWDAAPGWNFNHGLKILKRIE
ncbi:MAG: hypothetical protein KBD53_00505 [Candidatus Omnitrophica bacterium]|nr:hypothetical protein [Candidatus Omnitrophota bacterium]